MVATNNGVLQVMCRVGLPYLLYLIQSCPRLTFLVFYLFLAVLHVGAKVFEFLDCLHLGVTESGH